MATVADKTVNLGGYISDDSSVRLFERCSVIRRGSSWPVSRARMEHPRGIHEAMGRTGRNVLRHLPIRQAVYLVSVARRSEQ